MTSSDQEKIIGDFYDQLHDETFLGNLFEDEDNLPVVVIAPELSSSSDDDDDDVMDVLELDDTDNVVEEPHDPSLQRKQRLANLDKVTRYQNYDLISKNIKPFSILRRPNYTYLNGNRHRRKMFINQVDFHLAMYFPKELDLLNKLAHLKHHWMNLAIS